MTGSRQSFRQTMSADEVPEPVCIYRSGRTGADGQAVGTGLDLKTQPVGVSLEIGCGLADPPFNNAYTNIGTVTVPGATASDPSHYCNPVPTGVDLHEQEPGRLLFLPGVRG